MARELPPRMRRKKMLELRKVFYYEDGTRVVVAMDVNLDYYSEQVKRDILKEVCKRMMEFTSHNKLRALPYWLTKKS